MRPIEHRYFDIPHPGGYIMPRYPPKSAMENRMGKRRTSNFARTLRLAVPKCITQRYSPPEFDMKKRNIEIVQPSLNITTRLEELALPPVRCLVSAREEFKPILQPERVGKLNQYLQRSVLSRYNRLANSEMMQKMTTKK